jgi:hypothetical protein
MDSSIAAILGFFAQPPKKSIKNWRSCFQSPFAIEFEATFQKTMLGVVLEKCINAKD